MRSLIIVAALAAAPAQGAPAQDKPAASMHDLQTYFAACIQPPQEADGTRITFYFSLKRDGAIYGRPRVVWLGYSGNKDDRKRLISGLRASFAQCLPLRLDAEMSRTIPGKVYYLQFIIGADGETQVLLRPFGSMGDPLVEPEFY